ncbi:putative Histidine kinase [Nitrospira japonica]|uniref:histidine kinase n=1 Tax=Nitrospira japonica TaxID=1325564 RepID=A0A1W1I0S9_9BACT|nr:ATP-binding protein [Nitrospira japonica]SLM46610.1 putative Histidine kinase [Nitrospira japonica]
MKASSVEPASSTRGWRLRTKLIVSMLLVGIVPLLVGLGMAFWQGSREINEVSGESFKALATEAARKLDILIGDEISRTARIASDPLIIKELERRRDVVQNQSASAATAAEDQRAKWDSADPVTVKTITENPIAGLLHEYYTGARSEPGEIIPQVVRGATKMLFVTDVQGHLAAALTTKPKFDNGGTAWWKGAYNKGVGQLYIEDVYFDNLADTYVFSISMPIMDSLRYEAVGVLRRVIDAKEFFAPSTHPIRFGKTGHVMLIDSRGIVISCPILPTGVSLSDASLVPLVTPRQPGWTDAPSDGHGGRSASIIGFAPLPETSRNTNGSLELGSWHTFVWQSSDELFGPIRHLLTWMTVFALIAMALLATLGYLAATRIVTPVRQLQQAAQSIGRGELRQTIQIKTGDELETLAEEFNRMNRQLEAAFAGLTDQVTLKTQEVQYLRESTDQILDAVPTPILIIGDDESVQYVNRTGREAFDLANSDLKSPRLFEILPLGTSQQQQIRRELLGLTARAPAEPAAGTETESDTTPVLRDPLAPQLNQDAEDHRAELQLGDHLYRYQWFRVSGRPGEADRVGLVLRDTTEESRMQENLIQAEKSGSLGILTAGIGHELNNPLFGILGLGEAIQEEGDLGRAKSYAHDIVQHGRRMASIIRDFTGVATRESSDQRQTVPLERELDLALATLAVGMDISALTIERCYAGDTCVNASPDQLRQALSNILLNAVQAMRGRGLLRLTTVTTGATASVTITDSGPGIPKQHLSKIFDPFFTTKGQGEGSGLGLTVARRIIRKFGGDIRLESVEGQGTSCVISFPVHPRSASSKEVSCTVSDTRVMSQP